MGERGMSKMVKIMVVMHTFKIAMYRIRCTPPAPASRQMEDCQEKEQNETPHSAARSFAKVADQM